MALKGSRSSSGYWTTRCHTPRGSAQRGQTIHPLTLTTSQWRQTHGGPSLFAGLNLPSWVSSHLSGFGSSYASLKSFNAFLTIHERLVLCSVAYLLNQVTREGSILMLSTTAGFAYLAITPELPLIYKDCLLNKTFLLYPLTKKTKKTKKGERGTI